MGLRRLVRNWSAPKSMVSEPSLPDLTGRHLLITGTGRAGTTLMMRYMINLGLDTGYTPGDVPEVEGNIARAGLEHDISRDNAPNLPAIIKTPFATDVLHDALSSGWLGLWHVILPVRDLKEAADSRRAAQIKADRLRMDPNLAPGVLWKTTDPAAQEPILAVQLYKAIDALARNDIPLTLLSFPRFALDQDYFVKHVGPVLRHGYGVGESDLRRVHSLESRPEFIAEWKR